MVSRLSRGTIHRKNTLSLSLFLETDRYSFASWTEILFQKFISSDISIEAQVYRVFCIKISLKKNFIIIIGRNIEKNSKKSYTFSQLFFNVSNLMKRSVWDVGKNTRHRLLLGDARMPLSIDYSLVCPAIT